MKQFEQSQGQDTAIYKNIAFQVGTSKDEEGEIGKF